MNKENFCPFEHPANVVLKAAALYRCCACTLHLCLNCAVFCSMSAEALNLQFNMTLIQG
jgi:hypothetical protein